jgi:SpoVK/Ycf46/Vps4 family AAA+-type ATPase
MLVRALCRQLNVPMLSVTPSLLMRMYVGETPRLTKALFIDEADSLFCARTAADHSVDRKVVTECKSAPTLPRSRPQVTYLLRYEYSYAAVG